MNKVVPQPPAGKRLRVFLAEDDPDAVESLSRILSLEGCDVVGKAATERQAAEWFRDHPKGWDFAIVDLLLREGSGFNLLKHLASAPQAPPVVVYSAYVSELIREKARDFGASAVFSKLEGPALARYARGVRQMLDSASPSA